MMCCYYPTTVVAIDDDALFLKDITKHMEIQDFIPYTSPKIAINELSSKSPYQRIQTRIIRTANLIEESNYFPEDHAVLFNPRGLHEEIYNNKRFCDVSVLIVDYYMDELNGIDVCEALLNHPSKKILLTGGADKERVAIEAFNKGIIHRFISKADPNFPSKLKQAITILKDAYFRDLSSILLSHITKENYTLIHNPAYINFTQNLFEQLGAVEYYILDVVGSTLFLNTRGEPTWFMIKHESELKDYYIFAQDQEAPCHLIRGLAERKLIPFFFSDNDQHQPPSEWEQFFYKAQQFPADKNYFYSIFSGKTGNHIRESEIYPYDSFNQSCLTHYES